MNKDILHSALCQIEGDIFHVTGILIEPQIYPVEKSPLWRLENVFCGDQVAVNSRSGWFVFYGSEETSAVSHGRVGPCVPLQIALNIGQKYKCDDLLDVWRDCRRACQWYEIREGQKQSLHKKSSSFTTILPFFFCTLNHPAPPSQEVSAEDCVLDMFLS